MAKTAKKLTFISPESWEHPADKAALSALKQLGGLPELVKALMSVTTERSLKLMYLSSAVKVSQRQYPKLHKILNEVVEIFDWDYLPNLFVGYDPSYNACSMGVKEPFIALNSALVRDFDEDEITATVAHEMGHIMSGHSLYHTLLWYLTTVPLNLIPLAPLLIAPVKAALYEWSRKSELTADRAALLALQEPLTPAYNRLMRYSGAVDLTQVNLDDFFKQAEEYESQKSLLDNIHKTLNVVWSTHPFPVVRLRELKIWETRGNFQDIMMGNYIKRSAASETFSRSASVIDDTLEQGAVNIKKTAAEIGGAIKGFAGRIIDGGL